MNLPPGLPIAAHLPRLRQALAQHPNLVLMAEPGAGKTTVVPRLLLERHPHKKVWVLQPRRLAARLAARYTAAQMGEAVGETVGYQVRFESNVGPRTRLVFMTEGLFLRSLLQPHSLDNVAAIVFDEFHGRSLDGDLGLATACLQQRGRRPDLQLVVMSASLAHHSVLRHLDNAAVLTVPGRAFDVATEFLPHKDSRPLTQQVCAALSRLCTADIDGDILVFLPGVKEIDAVARGCRALADSCGMAVVPLHGSLSPEQQDAATGTGAGALPHHGRNACEQQDARQHKIILSTNVAETSVTLPHVVAVVDTGVSRVAQCNPWSGLAELHLRNISQAEALQRAGRAGRTRAGRCLRLYSQAAFNLWPKQPVPELLRLDLSASCLWAAAMGLPPLGELPLCDAPPASAVQAAGELLHLLGALDASAGLTPLGRHMAQLPLHPRLSRLLLAAAAAGIAELGALAAATLSEQRGGPAPLPAQHVGDCDLSESLARPPATVRRLQAQLLGGLKKLRLSPSPKRLRAAADATTALCQALLVAYPDRVAQRLEATEGKAVLFALCGGGRARLAPSSVVQQAPYLVALNVHTAAQRGSLSAVPQITLAAAVEPEWLFDLGPQAVQETTEVVFAAPQARLEQVVRITYARLVLDTSRSHPVAPTAANAAIFQRAVLAAGLETFVPLQKLTVLQARLAWVSQAAPHLPCPQLSSESVLQVLLDNSPEIQSFGALRAVDAVACLHSSLPPPVLQALHKLAPLHVQVGRRSMEVHYEAQRPPYIAAPLQDFFGLTTPPKLGEAFLTLHLLAPNRRPVQITTDLQGFWERHYPALQRTLSRRYPKHAWPQDPAAAKPPNQSNYYRPRT
jgi:ATP-dependent helicase HrpB